MIDTGFQIERTKAIIGKQPWGWRKNTSTFFQLKFFFCFDIIETKIYLIPKDMNVECCALSIDVIGICENCLFSFFGAIMSNHRKRFASHYESVIMPGLGCETWLIVRRCVSLFARVWCIDVSMAISDFPPKNCNNHACRNISYKKHFYHASGFLFQLFNAIYSNSFWRIKFWSSLP